MSYAIFTKKTKDYMLTYHSSNQLEIIGYSDYDYVGCQDSHGSTSSYIYMLVRGAISWKSTKQILVAS